MIKRMDLKKVAGIVFVLPLIMMLLPVSALSSHEYEDTEEMELSADGIRKLGIVASSCDVNITGVKGAESILVKITRFVRVESEEKARELAGKMRVRVKEKDEAIELVTEYPGSGEKSINIIDAIFGGGRKLRMELDITVPESMELTFETSSGDIEIEDIAAGVGISSASGDVEARMIGGKMAVKTASGDIRADNIESFAAETASGDIYIRKVGGSCVISAATGDVNAEDVGGSVVIQTISGDVGVENISGSTEIRSASGSVDIEEAAGGVKAFTASGDLHVEASPEQGEKKYELGTSSGSLTLIFRRILEGGYALKASTLSGEIEMELPIQISGMTRQKVTGVVREGESRVLIETSSGDITIKEKGA